MSLFIVCLFFISWLGLTIANQFETEISYKIRKLDVFGLIPVWRFFAPHPGIHDHYILVQDCAGDGKFSDWRQLVGPSSRKWESFIWNPGKWENKALADLVQLVAQALRTDSIDRNTLMLTSPYLVLLHFVLADPFDVNIVARRFALVRKQGRNGEVELSIASDFHSVSAN
jgi:hypothetical protein